MCSLPLRWFCTWRPLRSVVALLVLRVPPVIASAPALWGCAAVCVWGGVTVSSTRVGESQ